MNKQKRNFNYRTNLLNNPTVSELIFKERLEVAGIDYMFQKGFIKGDFHCIVDFYLPKPLKTCIEIDGSIHDTQKQKLRDIAKDQYLRSRGFKIVRIKNEDVETFDLNQLKI